MFSVIGCAQFGHGIGSRKKYVVLVGSLPVTLSKTDSMSISASTGPALLA